MVVDFLSAWITPKKRHGSTDSRSNTREEFWTRRARLSHSRSGLGYLKSRKRERGGEGGSRGRGSFIIRRRFKEFLERGRDIEKNWCALNGAPRPLFEGNSAPHYPALFLVEDEEGRRKEAGRFHLARDVRLSHEHKGAHYFMPYLVSWFTS